MDNNSELSSAWIVETDEDTFERDVFQRSKETPVVVDFWAAWCAPCRMLAPLLEQLANEYAGKFVLVKADTDRVPRQAAEFNVQEIPAVYGVCDGEVADFFSGALPIEQLREWIDRLLLTSIAVQAKQLEASDPQAAEAKYREVIQAVPNESSLQIGLARALLAQDRPEDASAIIEQLERRGFLEPEAETIKAKLDLQTRTNVDPDAVHQAAEQDPDDLQLQLQYAGALIGDQQFEPALDICLNIIERDKKGVGEEARQVMVEVFRVLPDDSELTSAYRRKLSMLLY